MIDEIKKKCTQCKKEKPLSDFYKETRRIDGRKVECKDCTKAYQQSEKGKLIKKAYDQSEKGKRARKDYDQSKKRKAAKKAYDQSDHGKAVKKAYNQSEKGQTIQKAYREKNRARLKAYQHAYHEKIKKKDSVEIT